MEQKYRAELGKAMRELSEGYRIEHQYTQEKMAERLDISAKAYDNLKHGRHSFSAATLTMMLIQLEDEQVLEFVKEIRILRKELWEQS